MNCESILIVRLGAMGDILHALPALESLRLSFPRSSIYWLIASKWSPLLEGNPSLTALIPFERHGVRSVIEAWRRLRPLRPELAFDFQGLIQSALAGRASHPRSFFGFSRTVVREGLASLFYSHRVTPLSSHVVDRNLELAQAAGATCVPPAPWIPPGRPEGELPTEPFVLCNPFAGWAGKQWPIERYDLLARLLQSHGLRLVLSVPDHRKAEISGLQRVHVYHSSLYGLIDATRRAAAVVGLDSGPLHLAAALQKPGAALFGPTDPARNGPYGGSMPVIRADDVATTYRRDNVNHPSMEAISAERVLEAVLHSMKHRPVVSERSV
ncbi:MAG TPA: glycosyltransferase family 9 protein [Bryobacteraceae bacterium]|jgi:heptosyltransferase-1|nr:glycosyltransferase family 9 protein [Bryobacteraceae bacterium]